MPASLPRRKSSETPERGRPLSEPVLTFAAMLAADAGGLSAKRIAELAAEDPATIPPAAWRVASLAHAEGCQTAADFRRWLKAEISEP